MRFLLLLLPLSLLGAEIQKDTRFQWKANSESDLAGYHLYFGPLPGFYTDSVTISAQRTNTTLPPMPARTYFALTAFNAVEESLPSKELSTTNHLRITLAISQAGTLEGERTQVTQQVWLARSSSNVFFFGSMTIERLAP
jgi:hypothetical protein